MYSESYYSIKFIPAYGTKINLARMLNESIFVDLHILGRMYISTEVDF